MTDQTTDTTKVQLGEPMSFSGFAYRNMGEPGVVAHAFNPSTWEAEAGRFLSSRPA
jgi:major histocompatibility complex class I